MSVHTCPACKGAPAKPALAHINTGADSNGHYWSEVVMTCRVCEGNGSVNGWVLGRYHKGRKHKAVRVACKESLKHAADRLGIKPSQLSAYEHGYADLPAVQQQGKEDGNGMD